MGERGRGGPRGGAAVEGRAGSPRLPDRAAQPRAPSASDGGSGDGDRGAEAVAETDTPPGGGSSPFALKAPRSFPRSPCTLPAAVAERAQRSPLDRRSEEVQEFWPPAPADLDLMNSPPGVHTPASSGWRDWKRDARSGSDANRQGIRLALGSDNTYKEPEHVCFWVVDFIPLRNHSNETSLLPAFEEQLVVSEVVLLVQLLPFPFEVCVKDVDLRLTPTSTPVHNTSELPSRCPTPLDA